MNDPNHARRTHPALEALALWLVFMVFNLIHHRTLAFVGGTDVREWVQSSEHHLLSGFFVYGLIFLVAPLILTKGWKTVSQPFFLIPLLLALLGATLWSTFTGAAVVIILVLVYLHVRFDLSELGIRSSGWRGDAVAVLLIAILYGAYRLFQPTQGQHSFIAAVQAGALRLFANPASTAEYFFYFGFIATRFSARLRPPFVAILVGLMYVLHEMTNPEYWYEGVRFGFIFVGVSLACGIYLWRRALPPIWLGDGLARAVQGFLA